MSKNHWIIHIIIELQFLSNCFGQFDFLKFLYERSNSFVEGIPDTNEFQPAYDFIIIGSGSGGSVMANRLSEIANWSVLLLEAGDEENFISDIPLIPSAAQITRYNWGYKTDPVPGVCLGLEGGVCNWPKGRALGGTSVINFMLYQRGHRTDFDGWAAAGNRGWTYDEVLPYFKKSENIGIAEFKGSPYHGENGYLDVQYARHRTKLVDAFIRGGQEMGYRYTDPNAFTPIGFSYVQATLRNGKRCSAAKAFLRPIYRRPNLHISMNSRVTKITIDATTKTATGIEFIKNKIQYKILAKKEVILSAGSIASPQLLMLSGIGPADHLNELGIPVLSNLKVGYNLQDHSSLNGLDFLINEPLSFSESTFMRNFSYALNYALYSTGPFTIPGGAEGFGFVKTPNSTYPADYPDIEIVSGVGGLSGDESGTIRNMIGITEEFYRKVYGDVIGKPAFGLVPVLLRPESRGRISLKSRNPFHWPRMEPNFFQNPKDMQTLIQGIKIILRLIETASFRQYGTDINPQPYLGCEHFQFGSDDYWECCIRRHAGSLQHQVGTCKMGPSTDTDAVVNAQLQVYGIRNLRVVDGSIMPTIPVAHTNAAIFMIGEKAADMVKEYWRNAVDGA